MNLIDEFLAHGPWAVIGTSKDRAKYGNKVQRAYMQRGMKVHPVHPSGEPIEGVPTVKSLAELPEPVHGLSIITPPPITERVVEDAARAGIRHLWMQPGAESPEAIQRAAELGLKVIHSGPCILVKLRYHEEPEP